MENTAKPVVEVIVEKNLTQISGSINNYIVIQAAGYEGGFPVGWGVTEDEALNSFKSSWDLQHDEEVEVKVIETKIV
jgi:hypothetical protein